jgi:hypothetical protein
VEETLRDDTLTRFVLKAGKHLVLQQKVLPCTYSTLHSIPPLHVPR